MNAFRLLSVALWCVGVFALQPASAQTSQTSTVVVTGEELPSAYGAPPGISRTRFSPSVTAYVLPPWCFYSGSIWQGDISGEPPFHQFTQEVEMGLPGRFGVAAEATFQRFNGGGDLRSLALEARYALADWNKIPLNPTIFVEYKFGTGRIIKGEGGEEEEEEDDEGADDERRALVTKHKISTRFARSQEGEPGEDEEGDEEERRGQPDAVEARLLLAQDFGEHFEWAMNGFFEQEVGGDRGREWGFAQALVMPLTKNERLKAGIEMQYKNFTDKDTRDEPTHSFVIGPTVAWKPSKSTRIDVSSLFGVTEDSPDIQAFVVFSWLLGNPGSSEAEAPVSTRNR
ncbi:MAG TPA: hypothetical protein VJS88_00465 [Chthoniobacterales bacterium]|nr:hypothetical protein [Chthoniobacterales bacterium]